jgi:hypothetical protein
MVHHSCQIPTNDVQLHELNKSSTQNNTHYQMANELMTLTGPNNKHNKQNNITSNASLVLALILSPYDKDICRIITKA